MATNVNDWYTDVLYALRNAPIEQTRNGRAKALQEPSIWTIRNPTERVLFNPARGANPYFHVMETVWMFAGEDNITGFLEDFNSRIRQYAEVDGAINGAYGNRWRAHFGTDQIVNVITQLKEDPETRQAVISMWDPHKDFHSHWKDRPCNTTIFFRSIQGRLDMTVCNRSNDAVWGMCGANAVHMTYLHELVAAACCMRIGLYHVMTNNLHLYDHHWHHLDNPQTYDEYEDSENVAPLPLLSPKDDWWEFLEECKVFVKNTNEQTYSSRWLEFVVKPMYEHYICRLNGDYLTYDIDETKALDWRLAEHHWRERNDN